MTIKYQKAEIKKKNFKTEEGQAEMNELSSMSNGRIISRDDHANIYYNFKKGNLVGDSELCRILGFLRRPLQHQ